MQVLRGSQIARSIYISLILLTVAMFLLVPASASFAGDRNSVSVEVTIGPSIRIGPGGAVKSNVSTLAFAECDLLTIVAR